LSRAVGLPQPTSADAQQRRRAKEQVLAVGETTLLERVHRALRMRLLGRSTGGDGHPGWCLRQPGTIPRWSGSVIG
jgi:hypothetical protein